MQRAIGDGGDRTAHRFHADVAAAYVGQVARSGTRIQSGHALQTGVGAQAVQTQQQALLQQQFSALQPSRGGPPQMYALFVAGDGSQEVFRREVAYVDAQIGRAHV